MKRTFWQALLAALERGEQVQLLGAAPGGISCLGTLPAQEAERLLRSRERTGGEAGMSFPEALRQVLRQRRK